METCEERLLEASEIIRSRSELVLKTLLQKWTIMYDLTDEMVQNYFSNFIKHLDKSFEDMVNAVDEVKQQLVKEVEVKINEIKRLEQALGIEKCFEYDQCWQHEISLSRMKSELDELLKRYDYEKNERFKKLKALRNRENYLCKCLGEYPYPIKNDIPTISDLEQIDLCIFNMEEKRIQRKDEVKHLRERIQQISTELEDDLPQIDLMNSDDENFILNQLNFKSLQDLCQRYENEFELAKDTLNLEWDKLKRLWKSINECDEFQKRFIESHSGYGKTIKNAVGGEYSRCLEIKKSLLEPLIKSTKENIINLFEQMALGEEERIRYPCLNNSQISEEQLDTLEFDYRCLKKHFDENYDIYKKARERHDLWINMLNLDKKENDKNRYLNRGGNLLKEERERKQTERKLPKLNEELLVLLDKYENDNGKEFTWHGENLKDKILNDWDSRMAMKNFIKVNRREQQRKIAEQEALMGVQVNSRKRKAPTSFKSPTAKRYDSLLSVNHTNMTNIKKNISRYNTRSSGKTSSSESLSNASVASSYSMFQEEIESKKRKLNTPVRCTRSRTLRDASSKNNEYNLVHSSPSKTDIFKFPRTPMKTPQKTPQKTPLRTPLYRPATPKSLPRSSLRISAKNLNFSKV